MRKDSAVGRLKAVGGLELRFFRKKWARGQVHNP